MSVQMSKDARMQVLHDLAEANERAIKRFGEPLFEMDWETWEIAYKGKRRTGKFENSDNCPDDPEQAPRNEWE